MKLAGTWLRYTGLTSLELARRGTFTLDDGRYWGTWKEGWFGSVTFNAKTSVGGTLVEHCSFSITTERDTGSLKLELRSNGGSPFDGYWYRSPK